MDKVTLIIGDYSSHNKGSLLEKGENIRSKHDGILYAGIIHYIQQRMPDFTLKAAISRILDKCPSIWPEDLPERIDKGVDVDITPDMSNEIQELNKGLILPIEGTDIVQIIRLAQEFLKEV